MASTFFSLFFFFSSQIRKNLLSSLSSLLSHRSSRERESDSLGEHRRIKLQLSLDNDNDDDDDDDDDGDDDEDEGFSSVARYDGVEAKRSCRDVPRWWRNEE